MMTTPASSGEMPCRRWNGRAVLSLPARLMLPMGEYDCLLEDLSLGGACIHIATAPRLGATAILKFGDHALFCTISWVKGQQCGLKFMERLPKDVVMRMQWLAANIEDYENERSIQAARNWSTGKG